MSKPAQIAAFWKRVQACEHKNLSDDYCGDPGCCMSDMGSSATEVHCKDCGVYIAECGCGCVNGMSGRPASWHRKRQRKTEEYRRREPEIIRRKLEENVAPEPNSGCLLWLGCVSSTGYGSIGFRGKRWNTHKLKWHLFRGPVPDGKYVLHKCDVRSCINLDHLYIGTAADNSRDAVSRGRHHHGETHRSAKLTKADVLAIMEDPRKYKYISADYGVSEAHISGLKAGKFWKCIDGR